MSNIAEKLITIAKNQNGIYHAGATRFAATNTTEKSDNITVTDSSDYKMLDFGLEGKTEQKTYTGKNLWNNEIINDPSNAVPNSPYAGYHAFPVYVGAGNKVTIHYDNTISDEISITACVFIKSISSIAVWLSSGTTRIYSKTITSSDDYIYVCIHNISQSQFGEYIGKYLQIEQGSTATEYEPYCGGTPSPNPDYPQEIVNAGKVGKNLLDVSDLYNFGKYKEIVSNDIPFYAYTIRALPNTTYFVSATRGSSRFTLAAYIEETNTRKNLVNGNSSITTGNTGKLLIMFPKSTYVLKKDTIDLLLSYYQNLQIEQGSEATEYEPFRYEIGCSLRGTNLFDVSKFNSHSSATNNGDGTITITSAYPPFINKISECFPNIKVGQTIIFSGTNIGNFYFGGNSGQSVNRAFKVTQEMLDDNSFGFYGGSSASEDNPRVLSDIMINEGNTKLPYTPYVPEKSFTLTSPVPLTKWDKLVKRDGVWGWSIYSYKLVVDGNAKWSGYLVDQGFYESSNMVKDKSNMREAYCNALSVGNTAYVNRIAIGYGNQFIYVGHVSFFDDTLADKGLANWKAYLNENPLEIWTYSDNEVAFHLLPDDEQKLLNSLETNYAGTVMYNDQGCPMWFEYIIDPELYGGEF